MPRVVQTFQEACFKAKDHMIHTDWCGDDYTKDEAKNYMDLALCIVAHHGYDIEEFVGEILDRWEEENDQR